MKRKLIVATLVFLLLCLLCGCALASRYDEKWIIGKTSAQVMERYGAFDQCGMPADSDGLYKNCRCSLVIIPKRVGFLGTTPPKVLAISFDEKGIAYETEVTLGGWGG